MSQFFISLFKQCTIIVKPFSKLHRFKLWITRLLLSNHERHLITEALAWSGRKKLSAMGETANEDGKYCFTLYHYLLPDKEYKDCD